MPLLAAQRCAVVASALSVDPRQAAMLARQTGFAGLLFDAYSSALDFTRLSVTGRRELRHVLSSQNQQLVGLRVDLGPQGLGPGADVDRLLAQFDRVMETAAALMAPLVCVEVGPLPEPPPENKPKPKVTAEQAGLILIPDFSAPTSPEQPATVAPMDPVLVAHVDGAMIEIGARADRYGVTVAFRASLAPFAALDRALRAARCPWFGIDLDPVAMLSDAWEAEEIFSQLGPLIRHVRGRDAVRGAQHRTKPMPIGQGDTKWDELMHHLDAAGYQRWVTVDPLDLPEKAMAARAGVRYLSGARGPAGRR